MVGFIFHFTDGEELHVHLFEYDGNDRDTIYAYIDESEEVSHTIFVKDVKYIEHETNE